MYLYLVDYGIEDPNTTKTGPVDRWLPNIECWPDSFVIFQGIRTSIAKKLNFCDFSWGVVSGAPDSPLDLLKFSHSS